MMQVYIQPAFVFPKSQRLETYCRNLFLQMDLAQSHSPYQYQLRIVRPTPKVFAY